MVTKNMEIIHMSFAKVYRFKGVTLEWHSWCGPIVLNRHTEKERQFKNISLRGMYVEHLSKIAEAQMEYETLRNKRNTQIAVIDMWRSVHSAQKKGNV